MIDLHTHILPAMDDGAEDLKTSLQMLSLCRGQGVTDLFFTPHFYPDRTSLKDFLARRESSYRKLCEAFDFEAAGIRPHLGAEIGFFRGIGNSDQLSALTLGDTNCLLIELPFLSAWPEDALTELRNLRKKQGFRVIIAHAERYVKSGAPGLISRLKRLLSGGYDFTKPEVRKSTDATGRRAYQPVSFKDVLSGYSVFDDLLAIGALIQVNSAFFTDSKTQKKALELLKNSKIQFIGSDAHNLSDRAPDAGKAYEVIEKSLGQRTLKRFSERGEALVIKQ